MAVPAPEDRGRIVGRAVVDDLQVHVCVRLPEHRLHGLGEGTPHVIGGDDHRHERACGMRATYSARMLIPGPNTVRNSLSSACSVAALKSGARTTLSTMSSSEGCTTCSCSSPGIAVRVRSTSDTPATIEPSRRFR